MKQLVVEVRGGLCNRLRVLISASYLAERYDRRLVLCWRANDDCGARFADLFTNPVAETDSLPEQPPPWKGCPPDALARAVQSRDPIVCVSECQWLVDDADEPQAIPHFFALRPVDAVSQAVSTIAQRFRGRTMGVHVRRGDFAEHLSRRHSLTLPPVQRYFAYLDDWRGSIFLATDGGDEVVGRFRDRYGDRVAVHPKHWQGRNTPQAIQDALVDVYLLQRCQALIGTRYSSFSTLAWTLTGLPHAKVTDREASLFERFKFSSRIMLSRIQRRAGTRHWPARRLSA